MTARRAARLPVRPPLEPMEASSTDTLPIGDEWQYEPKWDGFRCLIFRDGDDIHLQSKSKPLGRYFPDIVEVIAAVDADRFVLDGELVIPVDGRLSFDELLLRLHPAASRVHTLAEAHPASFIAFDLLVDDTGNSLLELPLHERRAALEVFARDHFAAHERLQLSPATTSAATARRWFARTGGGLDGIMAKQLDATYRPGDRHVVRKLKQVRTADCVVGGFRYARGGRNAIGSLLLGLYDEDGLLHHVGYTSAMSAAERRRLVPELEQRIEAPGFTGKAPGGPSRWNQGRASEWEPLRPELVVEVGFDHVSAGRFRHGTRFERWRPDKRPESCTMEQLGAKAASALSLLAPPKRASARAPDRQKAPTRR